MILDRLAHPADGLLIGRKVKATGSVDYTRMGGLFSLRLSGWSVSYLDNALEGALNGYMQIQSQGTLNCHNTVDERLMCAHGDCRFKAHELLATWR